MRAWAEIRGTRLLAICALAMSACVPAAAAPQTSSDDAAAKKPVATSATTTAHHKTTAKSSTSTASAKKSSAAKSTSSTKSATRTHTASTGKHSSRKKSVRARGQQKIDSERAQAIQQALIREHYLTGEATGTWNQASEEAMRRYQADNGWQSKTVPDSRALIKLGLGPSKDHLLNPESAMTTVPDAPRAEPLPTASHGASPGTDPAPGPAPSQTDSSHPQ